MTELPKKEEHKVRAAYRDLMDSRRECARINSELKDFLSSGNQPNVIVEKVEIAQKHLAEAILKIDEAGKHLHGAHQFLS